MTISRWARRDMISAMIQPMIVQPSNRLIQNTDQCGTSRTAAIAHGAMYPAVRTATTMATTLVVVQERLSGSTRICDMMQVYGRVKHVRSGRLRGVASGVRCL